MTEPFFFSRGRGLTVREIATLAGATLRPSADPERRITGIASLDRAAPDFGTRTDDSSGIHGYAAFHARGRMD